MNPVILNVLIEAIKLATQISQELPAIRAALGSDDKALLDDAYAELRAASNATADEMRAIPDDPVA